MNDKEIYREYCDWLAVSIKKQLRLDVEWPDKVASEKRYQARQMFENDPHRKALLGSLVKVEAAKPQIVRGKSDG